jgi:ABC-type polysaccharide/polyol phosphate export permease
MRDLARAQPVIRVIAARDFKLKYQQSILGPLWLIAQPVALLVAYLVAFRGLGNAKSSNVPYIVFALVGLSAWSFFQASMTIGSASVLTNGSFVRFTPCPRPAFPIAGIIASLPSFAVVAAAAIVSAASTGTLSPRVVLLPIGLIWLMIMTAGAVGISSSVAVRYRDVISALPLLLQVSAFVVPVGYSLAGLSPTMRHIVELYPLTGLIEAWRWMVLSGYHVEVGPVVVSLVLTAMLAVLGWRVFTRLETTMADEI